MKRVFKIILICSIACLVSCSSQTSNITEEKEPDKVIEETEEDTITFKSTSGNRKLTHEEYLKFLELMNKKEKCEDIFVIKHEATYKFEYESEEYAVYPFQDIVILLNYQEGQYYWFTETEDIDSWENICNCILPDNAIYLDKYEILQNKIGIFRINEEILKPSDYVYEISSKQIFSKQTDMSIIDSEAVSTYDDYDLIINNSKLYIREYFTQQMYEIEGVKPLKVGNIGNCGGTMHSIVQTTEGELYIITVIRDVVYDKGIYIDFIVHLEKLDNEDAIVDLKIIDCSTLFTTCGAPTICITTENDSEWQVINVNYIDGRYTINLGEKLNIVHPYSEYFELGDASTAFQEETDVNMLYVYEDSTIHFGVAHTKEENEEFSDITLKDEDGNDILYDGYIYINEEDKLERYIFKSKDDYLYEYPNDGNIYENLEKFYQSKVADIKISVSNDIKHLEVTYEDGSTFEFDGIVGYRN